MAEKVFDAGTNKIISGTQDGSYAHARPGDALPVPRAAPRLRITPQQVFDTGTNKIISGLKCLICAMVRMGIRQHVPI